MSKDFQWTEDLVKELLDYHDSHFKGLLYFCGDKSDFIEQFKQSKAPKPDYEILSFIEKEEERSGDKPFVLQVSAIPKCYKFEDYLKPDSCFLIHSVRRSADGEVFTVGDRFRVPQYSYERYFEIGRFRLSDYAPNTIAAEATTGEPHSWTIEYLQKAPAPLFRTEDGVDLFDPSDKVYGVCPKGTWEVSEWSLKIVPATTQWKWFSSDEARRDYVRRHKPCLSLVEVNDLTISPLGVPSAELHKYSLIRHEDLRELVNSKLQS